jgi:hypothetical protein
MMVRHGFDALNAVIWSVPVRARRMLDSAPQNGFIRAALGIWPKGLPFVPQVGCSTWIKIPSVWLPRLGEHCRQLMNYFFRNLHLNECQLDELWTFVYKKEDRLTPVDELLGIYGDAWVWIAFSPVCKLVPAWVVGKRTLANARKLVFRLKSATNGHIPFFTSDELPHYADALLEAYGIWHTPSRQGNRGRHPIP